MRLTAGAMAGLTALVTGVGTALVATAKMWGYDEDEVEFEADPRSTNFGRVKIRDMAVDLAGGFQTSIRIAAQLASGQAKSQAGEIYDVDGVKMHIWAEGTNVVDDEDRISPSVQRRAPDPPSHRPRGCGRRSGHRGTPASRPRLWP